MAPLRAMTRPEYEAWLAQAIVAYAADKAASGQWSAADSVELSTKEHAQLLPQGLSTPDNYLYSVVDERDQSVGMLWFAVKTKFNALSPTCTTSRSSRSIAAEAMPTRRW